jgi:putative DNA primase/helicase
LVGLLADISRVLQVTPSDQIATSELIAAIIAMDDRLWAEWNRGRPITAHQVAILLKPFRIGPKTLRFGPMTAKGYLRCDFADAFARYL